LLGKWSQAGEITDNEEFLGSIVQDICYNNAYTYFNLENNPLKNEL
jgi:glucuronate isomerase